MTAQTESPAGEDLPRAQRRAAADAAPTSDPQEPMGYPRPAPKPATRARRLAPRGPLLLVVLLVAGIVELMLWQAPRWIFAAVNVALVLLAIVIWRIRSRRRGGARRPRAGRTRQGGRQRRGIPGAGLIRGAAGWLGFGTGRRGSTPSAGRRAGGSAGARGSRGGLRGLLSGGGRGGARSTGGGIGGRLRGLLPGGGRRRGGAAGSTGSPAASRRARRASAAGGSAGPAASRGSRGTSGRLRGLLGAFRNGVRQGASNAPNPSSRRPNPITPSGRPAPNPARPRPTQSKETKDGGNDVRLPGRRSGGNGNTGGGSTPAVNPYGGNGRYGAGPDDRSMFAAGRSLGHAPEAFEDFAAMLSNWARELEEDQPMDLSIPEQIRAAIGVVRQLGADSGDWAANYRRRHEADEARLDSPARGSRHVEAKRDVTAAHREGL